MVNRQVFTESFSFAERKAQLLLIAPFERFLIEISTQLSVIELKR